MAEAFIAGATGFIGTSLLKALIKQTNLGSFKILVRNKEKATENLSEIVKIAKDSGKEIKFLEGDITLINMGLTPEKIKDLSNIEEVYHLASNISLSNEEKDKEAIFKCNIEGTKNLLEVFKDSDNLKNLYFFSSSYSC